jgi:hypothetical protein
VPKIKVAIFWPGRSFLFHGSGFYQFTGRRVNHTAEGAID